jgi:hypothetical protein
MASHSIRPTLNLAAGRAIFAEDLPRALQLHSVGEPEALGWRKHSSSALLVPVSGVHEGVTDEYLLRFDFVTDRNWPPKTQFVNPETLRYVVGQDTGYLPRLGHPEVNVHPAYATPVLQAPIQLICCSATFEYYDVLHGGDDAILWQASDTYLVTLAAIRRAMASAEYQGRHPADGQ